MMLGVFRRQLAIFGVDAAVDQNAVGELRVLVNLLVEGRQRRE